MQSIKRITQAHDEEKDNLIGFRGKQWHFAYNKFFKKSERLNDEVSGRHWHVVNLQNNEVYRFEFEHHRRC